MNIFYLDEVPSIAATYHCDKHVIKMTLESAQLLCTAINISYGEQIAPYKTTHGNHPCSIWVRESYSNWEYVFNLMLSLENEWQFRYRHAKRHKSVLELCNFRTESGETLIDLAYFKLPKQELTKPALAMPDSCKVASDPVECYRRYYKTEKQALLSYTRREQPFWLKE